MRAPQPEISSDIASARQVRKRTEAVARFREVISGNSAGSRAQFRHEVSRAPSDERLQILREAGFSLPESNVLPRGSGLAIKADMALPWSQLRTLRR